VGVDDHEFVLADIPGLVEGAHEGVGLGHRFLGHVERCQVLLHLVDGTADDPVGNWQTIRRELSAYDDDLGEKQEITAISKADSLDEERIASLTADLKAAGADDVQAISAVSGQGMTDLLRQLYGIIVENRAEAEERENPTPPWQP